MNCLFLGGGNMATAMMGGLRAQAQLHCVEIDEAARLRLQAAGYQVYASVAEAPVAQMDVIILAVKPQQLAAAVAPLMGQLSNQLVLSIAAGLPLALLSKNLGGYSRIVRAMPNTPALVGQGISGVFAPAHITEAERSQVSLICQATGQLVWLTEESQLDSVTAISGSGPAYVFAFMEAMMAAAVVMGFSEMQAKQLTLATFSGAATLAEQSDDSPAVLRQKVTSKGGTTAAALASMQADDIHTKLIKAMQAARARSIELGQELSQ
jgi:pyrroline-5-carboxylate reductase